MQKLSTLRLAALAFFMVSGGPFVLEDTVAQLGPSLAAIAVLVIPLLWAAPIALLIGEMAASLPVSGGYYAWVKRACGSFFGSLVAWAALAMSFFDMAIYPSLFVTYLAKTIPSLSSSTDFGAGGWFTGVVMMTCCAAASLLGTRAAGAASVVIAIALVGPFFVMAGTAATLPAVPSSGTLTVAAVMQCMWNYMGWDNASTLAKDVSKPQTTYPRGIWVAVAAVAMSYLAACFAASRVATVGLTSGSWVDVARVLCGDRVALAVSLGGAMCGIWMFCSLLTSYAQLPAAMARDGILPKIFALQTRSGVPWVSVCASVCAYAVSLSVGIKRLVEIDVILYGAVYAMQAAAFVALRLREPELPRPFRVPLGAIGAAYVVLTPLLLLGVVVWFARNELGSWSVSSAQLGMIALLVCFIFAALSSAAIKKGDSDVR